MNSLISKKMSYKAHSLVVANFENTTTTWVLIVANKAFISALDSSTAGFSKNWFTPVRLSNWGSVYCI